MTETQENYLNDYDEIAHRIDDVLSTLVSGTYADVDRPTDYPTYSWIYAISKLARLGKWCRSLAEYHHVKKVDDSAREGACESRYVIHPIESAPKDKTRIDIWAKRWDPDTDSFEFRRFPDCYWCEPPWENKSEATNG